VDEKECGTLDEMLLNALFFINSVSATREGRGEERNPHRAS